MLAYWWGVTIFVLICQVLILVGVLHVMWGYNRLNQALGAWTVVIFLRLAIDAIGVYARNQ